MDFASVPIIVVCCYVLGEIYKVIFGKKTKAYKFIPIVIVCYRRYFWAPCVLYEPGNDFFLLISIG